jgi:hypothetical protein
VTRLDQIRTLPKVQSRKRVSKARRSVGDYSPPEKRTGRDGKSYPAKPKRQVVEEYEEPGIRG